LYSSFHFFQLFFQLFTQITFIYHFIISNLIIWVGAGDAFLTVPSAPSAGKIQQANLSFAGEDRSFQSKFFSAKNMVKR
jgi:hypothetical protein